MKSRTRPCPRPRRLWKASAVAVAAVSFAAVAPQPALAAHETARPLRVGASGTETTEADAGLAAAIDTRRSLGFRDDFEYVKALRGGAADVGTSRIGLPLTAVELKEVERRESVLGRFQQTLEQQVLARPDFGGVYVDQLDGGKVVVLTTGDPLALDQDLRTTDPALAGNIAVRQVTVTAAELDDEAARLFRDRLVWSPSIPVFEVAVSYENTQITVRVPSQHVDVAARLAESALQNSSIRVLAEAGEAHTGTACTSRTNCYDPLRPGIRITFQVGSGTSTCTMAFHILLAAASRALTAGHCSGTVFSHYSYGQVGLDAGSLLCSGSPPYSDIKRISVPAIQQTSGAYGGSAGSVSFVRTSAWPVENATLRGSLGMSDTLATGIVTVPTMYYYLTGYSCELHGARHNLPSIGGDSGSPLWLASPNRAIGVHSSAQGAFGKVQLALDMWGASVVG